MDAGRVAAVRDVLAGGRLAAGQDRLLGEQILRLHPAAGRLVREANWYHRLAARQAVTGTVPGCPAPPATGVIFTCCGYPLPGGFHAGSPRDSAQGASPGALFGYACADRAASRYCRARLALPDPGRVCAYQPPSLEPADMLGSPEAQRILQRGPVMVQLQLCAPLWAPGFCAWALGEYARILRRYGSGSTVMLTLGVPGSKPDGGLTAGLGTAFRFYPHTERDIARWVQEARMTLAGLGDVRGPGPDWAAPRDRARRLVRAVAVVP